MGLIDDIVTIQGRLDAIEAQLAQMKQEHGIGMGPNDIANQTIGMQHFQPQLQALADGSNADALHSHSVLVP